MNVYSFIYVSGGISDRKRVYRHLLQAVQQMPGDAIFHVPGVRKADDRVPEGGTAVSVSLSMRLLWIGGVFLESGALEELRALHGQKRAFVQCGERACVSSREKDNDKEIKR